MANQHKYFTKLTIEKWERLVRTHLGRHVVKKTQDLMVDILAVDSWLKPSYLYDIGFPKPDELLAFVCDLKNESLVSSCLSVLQIGQDCLVVNPEGISSLNFQELCSDCLINVSGTLKSGPEVYRNQPDTQSIINAVTFIAGDISPEKSVKLQIDDNSCNITSLFGILLNYPLIYWYEQTKEYNGNCLSMQKLSVVKVFVSYSSETRDTDMSLTKKSVSEHEHCLYSFSYPSCLASVACSKVSDWFVSLEKVVNSSDMFLDIRLTTEEKTLEVVAL